MSGLRRIIPKEWTDKLRRIWRFDPDPEQAYFFDARTKVSGSVSPGFRYPAPGSQPAPRVPHSPLDADKTYNIGYFHRDTRRMPTTIVVASNDPKPARLAAEEAAAQLVAAASPGRPLPDAARYDPTGLRNTYTVTQAATQKALALHLPNHLPRPSWSKPEEEQAIVAKAQALGIPVGPGVRHRFKVPEVVKNLEW